MQPIKNIEEKLTSLKNELTRLNTYLEVKNETYWTIKEMREYIPELERKIELLEWVLQEPRAV